MKNKIIDLGFSSREVDELIKVSKNLEEDYEKLKQKYPIQYLIGYVNFYGYKIDVDENVLIPRYETELLVDKTINYIKKYFNNKINILDIGTGSGAISVALKKSIDCNITGVDISKNALEVAKKNAKSNDVDIDFIESDIFSNVKGKYDVIISNPPYIKENEEIEEIVKNNEPHLALYAGREGLDCYESILKNITKHMKDRCLIAFEIGYTQSSDITNLVNKYLDNVRIEIKKDLSDKDRMMFIFKNLE